MLQEFKEFALKGNVVDLAVGVIIGAAFGKIVDSLVNDIIMPIIGAITGGLDFSNMYFMLTGTSPEGAGLAQARTAGAVFAYGSFITVVVNFAIIAFVLFLVIKAMNQLKRKQEQAVAAEPQAEPVAADVKLLTEIRDLLAARR
jgi:large conductance mechanosensitive channel